MRADFCKFNQDLRSKEHESEPRTMHFDEAQWGAVDQVMTTLEQMWAPLLVALNGPAQRRRLAKMGAPRRSAARRMT